MPLKELTKKNKRKLNVLAEQRRSASVRRWRCASVSKRNSVLRLRQRLWLAKSSKSEGVQLKIVIRPKRRRRLGWSGKQGSKRRRNYVPRLWQRKRLKKNLRSANDEKMSCVLGL